MKANSYQCFLLAHGSLQAFSHAVPYHSATIGLSGHYRRGRATSKALFSRRKPFLRGSALIQGAHEVGKPRHKAERRAPPTQAISGWPDTALEKAIDALQNLHALGGLAVSWARSRSYLLERWYVKAVASVLLLLGIITAAANVWCLGPINQRYIPKAVRQAEAVLERKVSLGKVRWVAPSGLVGFGPLASVGPVSLGAGAAEKSTLEVPRVVVCVDPLQSLLQQKLILQLHADQAQVSVVQANNFAWFGYPDDPEPSARSFLPGLAKGLESEIAQHLEPSEQGSMGSGQPLGGLAARLASKVAKAEARQGMAPAPESAVNFRPAVGLELEVVSKDERDLIQGRAELEALLTQQRSAQAARVQSPPSTSIPPDSSQDMGAGTRRQLSKHRGSSSLEPAQQVQQAKRAEGYRERGHVSQPKASALRVHSSRPPFASISAGLPSDRPTGAAETDSSDIRTPEDAGHEADEGFGEGTMLQGEQRSEQPRSATPGQGGYTGPGRDTDGNSKGTSTQHLLPSLHGPSFTGKQSAPGVALQPLTADKSSADQESQQELAERLGLIRPPDSFARALGPRTHRRSPENTSNLGHKLSGVGNESQQRSSITSSTFQEGSAAVSPAQDSQVSSSTSRSKRRAAAKPQILELSGAEAQQDGSREERGHDRSQVSWLRTPPGASRALQVTKDGPKDALRHSQGLKVLLDDDARAKESEPQQVVAANRPGNAAPMAVSPATDPLQSEQQPTEAPQTSEKPFPSAQQATEAPYSSEDVHDNVTSRLHTETCSSSNPAASGTLPDSQRLPGKEQTANEKSASQGARRWRLCAPSRQRAHSALSEGRLVEQDSRQRSWPVKEHEDKADAPADSAVTGIEDIQADANDSISQAEGVGADIQHEGSSQGESAAEDVASAAPGGTENCANAFPDPGDADDPQRSDRTPGWALQLRKQLKDSTAGVRAHAQGLIGGFWERQGWSQGTKQDSTPPAEPPSMGPSEDSQPVFTAALDDRASQGDSAAVHTELTVASRGVGGPGRHFSLHRSHAQLFVSTADSAAASASLAGAVEEALAASLQQRRPRRKVRLVPQAVLPEHGLREQSHETMASVTPQSASQLQPGESDFPEPAAAESAEVPSTEEEEEATHAPEASQHHPPGSREQDTFSASEGASITEKVPEPAPAAVQDPASFELMAISAPRFLGPGRNDLTDTASAAEAAPSSEQSQVHPNPASEGDNERSPPESETPAAGLAHEAAATEHGEEPATDTAAMSEQPAAEQQAEEQAHAHAEPLQPAPEPAPAPPVPETQEATSGEVDALVPAAPAAAEPKVEPPVVPESGRSKAKHSWHSPSLSARYGELPYDEPRYKPRIPDADQGGLRAWAAKRISATLSQVRPPQLALERVVIRNGDLWATLTGEAIPRHIQNVNLQLKLGRDYRTLMLDITGLAHERDAASDKCTMINSIAQRHLRDAPSAPIVRSFSEVPEVAAPERSPSAQPDSASLVRLGRDRFDWEEQLQNVAKEAKESPAAFLSSTFGDSGDLDDPIHVSIAERQQGRGKRSWFGGGNKDQPRPARPTGGRVRVRVRVKEMGIKDRLADLDVSIWGEDLHAPLIERLVELPMDIYGGRINGKLRVLSNDVDSWRFPIIKGRLRGHDLGFHFFDAPDDFSKTKLDLLFEGDRLYMHGAQGFFGAVPLNLTGDMDLNPETGQYRLSASVPGVEGNDLRRTLAIRPLPFPVGGRVRGVLHVTGPLETPVFSGTAVAMPPKAEDVAAMEESNARETLQEFPTAAGAYDRMPFASAAAVWTLDTSTDIFLLHSFQAQPLSGGQLLGNGRMWVSPSGEVDPRAVKVRFEGRNLPAEALLKRYLPKGAPLPPMELGDASVTGTMEGSFLAPDMHLSWEAPEAAASGSVDLSRDSNSFTCRAPAVDVSAALLLKPAPIDAVKTVLTQAEATALAQPQIEGADIDCNFKGLDVLPLAAALDRGAAAKTQRLKLNGRTKFSVRLTPQHGPLEGAGKGRKQAAERPSAFSGDLSLDGLRVNQLKLSRHLTGSILLSNEQFQIRAKGMKPDEVLEVSLKLPFAPGTSSEEPSDKAKDSNKQSSVGRVQGTGGALLGKQRPALGGLGTLLPRPRFTSPTSPLLAPQNPALSDAQSGSTATDGGHFMLRCGNLLMSTEVNAKASQVECAVQGLLLDELELASLRGEVQEALLSLNLESRLGRAVVSVAGPRFSGLQGQSLSGAFRWERDVVRLERAVLQQANSRYEVQGEYVIPSVAAIPKSAAEMALMQGAGGQGAASGTSPFEQADGRWRVQVSVPTANMEEIIPAARLLSRATALTHSDYERAKGAFLSGMDASGLAAQEIGQQLEAAALAMRMAMEADANTGMDDSPSSGNGAQHSTSKAAEKESKQSSQRSTLPGLQDLKGQWSGGVQAYGGGGGATNVDFNVRGQSWQWGDYALDQVVADGSCHSIEGIKLEELALKTGEAKLLVRGNLLGAAQDASIILTDFPVAILQPMFRALPALEHAAPAVAASGASGGSSGGGALSGLAMPFVRGAHLRSQAARPYTFSNSPVNGLLYVRGTIGGSAAVPEGEVVVRLYDGAVGPTYLAHAQAQASLSAAQQLAFSADLAPAEAGRHSGHVRVSGSIPLRPSAAGAILPEAATGTEDEAAAESPQQLEVDVSVKDGGMMLVTALTPDLRWQSGAAELALSVRGAQSSPQIEGRAHFSKAAMLCPWLKYPITNLGGSVHLADGFLMIEGLEAHVGRRGRIRVKGGLPLTADSSPAEAAAQLSAAAAQDGETKAAGKESAPAALLVDVQGLEMRVRNVYTGYLDAGLKLLNSLTAPLIGGDVRISRGVASLMPGGPSAPGSGSGGSSQPGGELGEMRARVRENDLVLKAFTVLTRKDALARQLSRLDVQQAGETSLQPMALCLNGLKIHLGPELRAMFPVVLNMGISGDIELNGAADPDSLRVAGTIHLDGGEVNLVATQLVLDREHPNRLVFSPSRGLDPLLDLRLRGAQVQALIQGRASAWQQNLILTPTKGGAGDPRGATEAAEAARIFEGQLAGALVAEDGQLALSNLAASAAHGFMPKIQTQGQLGQARWRLVSAPSIPGLLSLDPSGDPTSLLSSLTMGTEVEVQFGRSLQAAMARKLRDSDIATQWTLNYQLNSKLRMQFNIASSSPYPRTLVFQYSSETTPPPLPR